MSVCLSVRLSVCLSRVRIVFFYIFLLKQKQIDQSHDVGGLRGLFLISILIL